jgi:hypothetical protein
MGAARHLYWSKTMALKNKYLVGATISAEFEEGDKLKTADRVVAYARGLYNMGNEPPLDLTDDEILAVCEAIPSTDDPTADWSLRYDALEKGAKVKPEITATGSSIRLAGINFGRALPVAIDAVMDTALKAKDDTDELPMKLAYLMDKALPRGGNGKITAPIPGTPESETIKNADGTETVIKYDNPDRFVTKTSGVREVSSYYLEAAMQRPSGAAILKTLAQIEAASGDGSVTGEQSVAHPSGTVTTLAEFKSMRAKDRKGAKSYWKGKLDYLANKMRRGAMICFKCEAINAMDRIEMTLVSVPKANEPARTIAGLEVLEAGREPKHGSNKPIMLIDTKVKGSLTDPMSVTSFLRLDPDAVGEGASLEALIATGEKAAADKAPAGASDVVSIDGGDLTKWTDYLAETTAWIIEPSNLNVLRVAAVNGKLPPQVIASMHDLEEMLSSMNAYTQKQFDLIETQRQAEREAEAADKQAKLAKTG